MGVIPAPFGCRERSTPQNERGSGKEDQADDPAEARPRHPVPGHVTGASRGPWSPYAAWGLPGFPAPVHIS
jgi:hypothetical protein